VQHWYCQTHPAWLGFVSEKAPSVPHVVNAAVVQEPMSEPAQHTAAPEHVTPAPSHGRGGSPPVNQHIASDDCSLRSWGGTPTAAALRTHEGDDGARGGWVARLLLSLSAGRVAAKDDETRAATTTARVMVALIIVETAFLLVCYFVSSCWRGESCSFVGCATTVA
jgi:hypothetical protein